jgi:hypothetical protein
MGISAVIREQVAQLAQPTTAVLEDLRRALDAYESAVMAQCLRQVEAPMAEMLGVPADPEVDAEPQRKALQQVLDRTLSLIRKSAPPKVEPKQAPRLVVVEPPKERKTVYPKLQQVFADGSIMMVGGFTVPGKLESITEAYGLVLGWTVFEKGSPRIVDSISARIKQGKVGAVVILEGFMTHKDYRKISTACKKHGVPYAMGGKGGHGELRFALEALESRIKRAASSA